jgi:Na+:H+ antiporter
MIQAIPEATSAPYSSITTIMALLLVSSAVAMATKWIRVPYTLALVIVGLVISPMQFLPAVQMSPDLILLIFLPALLFEAAWNLKLDELRGNVGPILTLATAGVVVSMFVIAVVLRLTLALPWPASFLFGAIISATDPVSVLALFKKLGAPSRLNAIVEGESLFNDGTSVVLYSIVLGIVTGATVYHGPGELAAGSIREFSVVVFGGIGVGAIVGMAASTMTAHFDDHLLEITLTTIAAYGSFLLAETFHVSPVIAVLIAGLVIGNYGRKRGMSPTTQVAVNSFWEYAAFVVNSLVFLLIGLEIHITQLVDSVMTTSWAVFAMLVGRAVAVYGLLALVNLRSSEAVPTRWQHIMFWGGLRGSLSIALVLSLPASIPGRSVLIPMVFGSVVFSLLVQGLSIPRVLGWVGISPKDPEFEAYEHARGRMLAESAALSELDRLRDQGMVGEEIYATLRPTLMDQREGARLEVARYNKAGSALTESILKGTRQRLSDVKKARLASLLREGLISRDAFSQLTEIVDKEESERRDHSD